MNGLYVIQYGERVSSLNQNEDYYVLDGRHYAVREEYWNGETRIYATELDSQPN